MAPPSKKTTVDTSAFPTWDELVAEAHVDKPPYLLPLPEIRDDKGKVVQPAEVLEILCPSGGSYVSLTMWQQMGNASQMLFELFPEGTVRARVLRALRGADFPIVDLITTKVLQHFYGTLPTPKREDSDDEDGGTAGKSDAA
jgi:hypothetical protein